MKKILPIILSVMIIFGGCGVKQTAEKPKSTPSPTPAPKPQVQISLTAVGDNLIHSPIYKQALARGGSRYDFSYAYANIAKYIDSDINILNQETPIGGKSIGISSYPAFNSPFELGEEMLALGFNVMNHANNHFYDAGAPGVLNSMDFWKQHNTTVIGVHEENGSNIRYIEKKGIKLALLAYTYGTNSGCSDKTYSLNRLDEETLKKDLAEARKNADLVILSLHFGNEYELESNAEQQKYAKLAAKYNTDILIGHHPHVLQEADEIKRSDGRLMPVYYSLGNFISSQDVPKCMIGGMVKASFKGVKGDMKLEKNGLLPVVTHFGANYSNTRNYLWKDYSEELAAGHGLSAKGFSYEYAKNLIHSVIDDKFTDSGNDFVQ